MKQTIRLLALVILVVTMSLWGVVSSVRAQQGCSLASFQGTYGVLLKGFFQFSSTIFASLPSTTVGILTADGAGGISFGPFTASQNGNILTSIIGSGTYTVDPDCRGSFIVVGGGGASFVIVAKGSQILFLGKTPGSVESGVGIKQGQSACSLASLQGTYGVHLNGFAQSTGTTVQSIASNPFAAVGLLTADGAGGLSTTLTNSINGIIGSLTGTGTYTVNPDCTGSVFQGGGPAANFVIVAKGSQVLFITTTPGSVQSGVLVLTASAAPSNLLTFTTVDVPGSIETDAFGINNSGQISGDFADSTGREHGFLLAGGSFSTVDVPGSVQTFGRGINDRGQTVGNYLDSTFKRRGYLLSSGSFITFDFPGAIETRGVGINNSGAIVGRYRDTGGIHGYLLSGGTFTAINFPGAIETRAFGINDLGQVVGRFRDSFGAHAFLLGMDGFRVLDFPGAIFTEADGINNRGEIVGDYEDAAGMFHGFLLSGGTFRTIDFPGAIETDPLGINDAGQIVGSYADSSGKFHGFLAHR